MTAAPNTDGERYELLGELATGGMATVYLGRMRRPMGFSRLVAVKCMHPQYAKDPSFASMFLDEARLTARLRHPNIVPTLDIVRGGGHLLIVMEYVEGESLSALLRMVRESESRIPASVACAIIHDLLLGLHEAHEAKDDDGAPLSIVHRDVSPQNVMVGIDGLTRVLDFGVAKARSRVHHSNEGEIKGKIPYMPPEQLFGEGLDRRVDIYAAGVLLWEALVGKRLFDGSNEECLVRRIDAGDVAAPSTVAPGISPELDAVVLRALSKVPEGRYDTALEMAEALSAIVTLPPRTEISAWVKPYARPRRSVPETMIGTSIDDAHGAVSSDELVAVLQRETLASRPSFVPVSTSSERLAQVQRQPTSRLAMAFGVIAFALAGILVGRTMRAENAFAEKAHRTAAVVAPLSAPSSEEPVPPVAPLVTTSAPPEAAPVIPAPKVARKQVLVKPAPKVVTPEPAPIVAPEPAPDPKAGCRLPYEVDAEGHRHYKVRCL